MINAQKALKKTYKANIKKKKELAKEEAIYEKKVKASTSLFMKKLNKVIKQIANQTETRFDINTLKITYMEEFEKYCPDFQVVKETLINLGYEVNQVNEVVHMSWKNKEMII